MSRIEPDWVGELLGQWAVNDWRNAQQDLGFPSVSPMFARAVVRFTLMVQEEQVASRMGDSDFDRQAQETLRIVRNASTRGRTQL